jgi:hypothetical protein
MENQTIQQKCAVSSNLVEGNFQETDQGLHAKISALAQQLHKTNPMKTPLMIIVTVFDADVGTVGRCVM